MIGFQSRTCFLENLISMESTINLETFLKYQEPVMFFEFLNVVAKKLECIHLCVVNKMIDELLQCACFKNSDRHNYKYNTTTYVYDKQYHYIMCTILLTNTYTKVSDSVLYNHYIKQHMHMWFYYMVWCAGLCPLLI